MLLFTFRVQRLLHNDWFSIRLVNYIVPLGLTGTLKQQGERKNHFKNWSKELIRTAVVICSTDSVKRSVGLTFVSVSSWVIMIDLLTVGHHCLCNLWMYDSFLPLLLGSYGPFPQSDCDRDCEVATIGYVGVYGPIPTGDCDCYIAITKAKMCSVLIFTAHVCRKVMFSHCLSVCVCLCVCPFKL